MRKCKEIKDKKKLEEWKDVIVEVTVAMIPIIATFLVAVGTCIVFYWIGKRGDFKYGVVNRSMDIYNRVF